MKRNKGQDGVLSKRTPRVAVGAEPHRTSAHITNRFRGISCFVLLRPHMSTSPRVKTLRTYSIYRTGR